MGTFFKHEYLRSRNYHNPNYVLLIIFHDLIEILVLTSWIPASKNFV